MSSDSISKFKLNSLTHHAYCLVGNHSLVPELEATLSTNCGIPTRSNPDFYFRKYEIFNIDNARELKSLHETRPIGETGKSVFIMTMNGITVEAQNALLKLLEEPAVYAHFFLIIPSAHLLLPTVKSRLLFIGERPKNDSNISSVNPIQTEAEVFIKNTVAKKMETIKTLLDDISKDKKPKQDAIDFLNAVERVVYSMESVKKNKDLLETISLMSKYINDRSPSLKMLLESVALLY